MNSLLTVREVSQYIRLHPITVYRLVEGGQLPHIRLNNGKEIRFRVEEIDSWLASSSRQGRQGIRDWVATLKQDAAQPPLTRSYSDARTAPGGPGEMAKAKSRTRLNFGYGAIYQRKTKDGRIRWYLDYRDAEGKRIQRVEAGASSPEEAQNALKKALLAEQSRVSDVQPGKGRITFADFSRIFLDDYAMNVKRSWQTDECRLGVLKPFFKDVYLDEVTPLMVQKCLAWRLKRGNTKSTANRYLALLKKIFNIAVEEGYLEKNSAARIKKFPGADRPKERILSSDEEAKLMEVSSPGLRSILIVALNTGMRYGEILNLTWAQVDFDRMQVTVEKTKSGKPRTIPFNAALQAELVALKGRNGRSPYVFPNPKTGEPVTTIQTAFHTACRRADITGLRFHDLRHTFASRLVENGADIEIVRFLLGHSSLEMTQRYVHSTDERRRQAVEKLTQNLHLVVKKGENLLHGCDTDGKTATGDGQPVSVSSGLSEN